MLWIIAIFLIAILLIAYQAYAAKNYLDPNAPIYSGNYATGVPETIEILTVVSYNIGYALHVDQAIAEIKQIRTQKGLDILLLQEMDEVGMEQIARELELNYVYYPAAIESTYHKNFGNAVLSRWPIVDSQKLILPHISFSNRMKRIATRVTIHICGEEFFAYSIHTEPVFTLPQFKVDQYTAVLNDVDFEARHVIVGGDFNSFTKTEIEKMEKCYRSAGFERASRGVGPTFARWGIWFSPDHIFVKGFLIKDVGKLSEAKASDHLPLWVTLTLMEHDVLHQAELVTSVGRKDLR
jgi:endonuclease/exonuclease/phosphatase family metal-dependent hydrolase